jgi:hypothetical protein
MENIEQRPKPYPLRLESELTQWVKKRSKAENRSINAELNRIVRKAKEAEEQQKIKE